jgi:fumarate hydratase class II
MLATQLIKMCNDLMIMSSGPTNGLNEINIPAVQPGSSIMPGKVNPVILESVIQVCSRVIGNDASITFSASNAFFELNTNTLFIGEVMLNSMKIMSNAMNILTEKTIKGITANVEVMERYANSTVALSTVLTKVVGYDKAAEIAKLAVAEQSTVKDAAIKLGILEHISEEELNDLLDPRSMLYPIRRNSKIVVNV